MTDDAEPLPPILVLYDGVCGFCDRSVRWLIERDRARALRFAPLQGPTAARLRAMLPSIPRDLDTVVLVEGGRVSLRSRAFVRLMRHLPPPWRWLYALRFFPAPILDLGYRFIARIRYRIWGKKDSCTLPSPSERALFLP